MLSPYKGYIYAGDQIEAKNGYRLGGTTVIDASRNGVFEKLRADGGNLIMGNEAYSSSTAYVGMKTALQSGSSDYMILSGLTDGSTYVSAKNDKSVYIRGGGNSSSNVIQVPDSTYILATTSDFRVSGNVTAYYSDERLKAKTGNIDNALTKVLSLSGFTYVENDLARSLGYNNKEEQVALSAQDVQKVMPQAVSLAPFDMETDDPTGVTTSKSGENYLTVDYSRLTPLLVEAIKEQQKEIDELKSLVKQLLEK
tara:strand:- start:20 stop:781 length:762 start_codon:yes stop_codon:yes gene_type:complete